MESRGLIPVTCAPPLSYFNVFEPLNKFLMLIERLTHPLPSLPSTYPLNLPVCFVWVAHTKAHMLSFPPYSHNLLSTKLLPSCLRVCECVSWQRGESRGGFFLFCCRLPSSRSAVKPSSHSVRDSAVCSLDVDVWQCRVCSEKLRFVLFFKSCNSGWMASDFNCEMLLIHLSSHQ